jgi:hypothetical protein
MTIATIMGTPKRPINSSVTIMGIINPTGCSNTATTLPATDVCFATLTRTVDRPAVMRPIDGLTLVPPTLVHVQAVPTGQADPRWMTTIATIMGTMMRPIDGVRLVATTLVTSPVEVQDVSTGQNNQQDVTIVTIMGIETVAINTPQQSYGAHRHTAV